MQNRSPEVTRPAPSPPRVSLPLFESPVSAGFPSPATDYVADSLDLNEYVIEQQDTTFFVRAKGVSMIGAGIQDGDLLVVNRAKAPAHRKIVIAVVDGEFTVKRLYKRAGRVRLLAENPDYSPIDFADGQELVIWGVVTGVVRLV